MEICEENLWENATTKYVYVVFAFPAFSLERVDIFQQLMVAIFYNLILN